MSSVGNVIASSILAGIAITCGASLVGTNIKNRDLTRENAELFEENIILKNNISELEYDIFQLETEKQFMQQVDSIKNIPNSKLPKGFMDRFVENAKILGKYHEGIITDIK